MALQSQEMSSIMARFLVQEVDHGPPESEINDLPVESDALRYKIHSHKTAYL